MVRDVGVRPQVDCRRRSRDGGRARRDGGELRHSRRCRRGDRRHDARRAARRGGAVLPVVGCVLLLLLLRRGRRRADGVAAAAGAGAPNVGSTCYSSPWATISDCGHSCATCGTTTRRRRRPTASRAGTAGPSCQCTTTAARTAATPRARRRPSCSRVATSCATAGAGAAAATDRGGDCTDSCFTRGDGYCDDGGPCRLQLLRAGHRLNDCGTRNAPPALPKADVVPPPPPSPPSPPPEGDARQRVCGRRVGGKGAPAGAPPARLRAACDRAARATAHRRSACAR